MVGFCSNLNIWVMYLSIRLVVSRVVSYIRWALCPWCLNWPWTLHLMVLLETKFLMQQWDIVVFSWLVFKHFFFKFYYNIVAHLQNYYFMWSREGCSRTYKLGLWDGISIAISYSWWKFTIFDVESLSRYSKFYRTTTSGASFIEI